jgi:hypothetical protein
VDATPRRKAAAKLASISTVYKVERREGREKYETAMANSWLL